MERILRQDNIGDTPPFRRVESRLHGKLEKSLKVRNMIKDKISEIESRMENAKKEELSSDEYFDFYASIRHLMPIAEKLNEPDLVKRLERQNKEIEKIKKARQEEKFKKITSRMSFNRNPGIKRV